MAANENAELEELIRNAGGGEAEVEDDSGAGLDIDTLLLVARRSLLWILLLIVLGIAGSWLYLRYTKPIYQSSSILKIDEKTEAGALGLGGGIGGEIRPTGNKLLGEIEFIKSNIIYEHLKDSLALDVNYYVEGTVLENELYGLSPFSVTYKIKDASLYNIRFDVSFLNAQQFRLSYHYQGQEVSGEYRLSQPIVTPALELQLSATPWMSEGAIGKEYHFVINDAGTISDYLNKGLSVQIVNPEANTIQISFTDFNPKKAQAIVNKVDTVYLQEKIAKKQEATQRQLKFLDTQLVENKDSLQGAEKNLERFTSQNKTYDVKSDMAATMNKLVAQEKERLQLEQQLEFLDEVAALVEQDQLTSSEDVSIAEGIPGLKQLNDEQLAQQLTRLNDLQWDLRRVSLSYRESTMPVQQREADIKYVRNGTRRLIQRTKRLLQQQLSEMNQERDKLNAQLQQLPERATQQTRLQRPYALYEKTYLMLLDKKMEFNIAKAGATADFQILSPASGPSDPIAPKRVVIYAIGLAAGIVLGLSLIAGRYLMHNTVTNVRELERATTASVLGVIPTYDKEKMSVSKLVVDKNPKSAISESIRSIRTNLDFISSAKKKRLISVTSTISGEGKTFVTVNLGGIIALSGQQVVILDLDMRKPKVNLAFGAENIKGISTILIDKHSIQECIQHTSIPSLDFISAGPTPPNPSELILNARFDEMIAELYQQYDVILIDTPPVGLVTDGILIMRKADIPIYIVRANYSKKAFLKNINKLIRANNFTRLSTILNDAQASGLYGYGYGYSYGQGYYDEAEPAKGIVQRLKKQFS